MYSYTEAATHVCHLTIMVYAGEQSEAVDNKYLRLGGRLDGGLRIAYSRARQTRLYLPKMLLTDDMRRNDQFPVGMIIEKLYEYLLIGQP